jgi:hypothetical protein
MAFHFSPDKVFKMDSLRLGHGNCFSRRLSKKEFYASWIQFENVLIHAAASARRPPPWPGNENRLNGFPFCFAVTTPG